MDWLRNSPAYSQAMEFLDEHWIKTAKGDYVSKKDLSDDMSTSFEDLLSSMKMEVRLILPYFACMYNILFHNIGWGEMGGKRYVEPISRFQHRGKLLETCFPLKRHHIGHNLFSFTVGFFQNVLSL